MLKYLAPIAATTIVILILLVATLPLMQWFEADGRMARLSEHRSAWENLQVASYRWTVTTRCDCPPFSGDALDVRVADGRVVSVALANAGEALSPDDVSHLPLTVDAQFAEIEMAAETGAATIDVQYDDTYGFPRELRIDPDAGRGGDELWVQVDGFDPRGKR